MDDFVRPLSLHRLDALPIDIIENPNNYEIHAGMFA